MSSTMDIADYTVSPMIPPCVAIPEDSGVIPLYPVNSRHIPPFKPKHSHANTTASRLKHEWDRGAQAIDFCTKSPSGIWNTKLELPTCNYYFLSDDIRDDYFIYWFIYQSFGMYGHMMYNVNIDTFIAGLIFIAVSQMKVLNFKLLNLKVNANSGLDEKEQDRLQTLKLTKCLEHYNILLRYCMSIQEILDVIIFVQFAMASIIICVTIYGLLLLSTNKSLMFMVSYLLAMLCQIFIPSFLGTLLSFESENLVFAGYNSEWIPRSEKFKKILKIFMERAKTPIVLTGYENSFFFFNSCKKCSRPARWENLKFFCKI
ncbi:putative odorant receptor 92a isoform X2 [Galleria mellonella]|uniref:Odorant receptor 92a isoform X2 n=1 Tax=Galleria mellonella TaxID=7137 RepID=A0A6J3C6L0_GALME|nr:putative odorant receptor 92a isoform X2 [Galleria mellonella]